MLSYLYLENIMRGILRFHPEILLGEEGDHNTEEKSEQRLLYDEAALHL